MVKKTVGWLKSRAKEPSTYTGLAIIASVMGAHKLGMQIDQIGQAVGLVIGGGLIGTQSSN